MAVSIPYPAPYQVWIGCEIMDSFFISKCKHCFLLHVFWFFCVGHGKFPAFVSHGAQAGEKKQTLCSAEGEEAGGAVNFKHKLTPNIFYIVHPGLD